MADKTFHAEIQNEKQVKEFFNSGLTDIQRFAMAATANKVAFLGIEKANSQFRKEFVLSNNYLTGTAPGKGLVQYNKAIPSHDINKIESSFGVPEKKGSTDLSFMEDQETGFTHKGMIPTQNAYPGQDKKKVIKRNLRRHGIQIRSTRGFPRGVAKNNRQRTLLALKKLYSDRFALPGSKEFIYLKPDDEYFGFSEGMYQFTSGNSGDGMFPHLRLIYAKNDRVGKRRKPTRWMEKTKDSFTQAEIDAIFEKELDRSFTQAIKKRKF